MLLSVFLLKEGGGGGGGREAFLQIQGPISHVCDSFLWQFQTACLSWDFLWLFTFSLSENQLPSCNKPHLLPLRIIETPLGWWHYPKEGHHTVGRHKLGPFHVCIRNTAVTEICIKSVSIRAISVRWWWFWRRRGRLWSTTLTKLCISFLFPLRMCHWCNKHRSPAELLLEMPLSMVRALHFPSPKPGTVRNRMPAA